MRVTRTFLQLAAVATTAAVLTAPQLPSFAATRAARAISIRATTLQPVVTGDIWVIYRDGRFGNATISGSATGAASGQVLRLYARRFPFAKAAAPVGSPVSVTGSPQPYAFRVTPVLATRYQVRLFSSASATRPLAASAVTTVFVVGRGSLRGSQLCSRPICHETFHLRVHLPHSTLRREMAKRWFIYFGLNLNRHRIPPLPRFLRLGAGNPHVSKARRLSGHAFAVTITLSFRVGNEAYNFYFIPCSRDTEAKDGLNLPGHHGCGTLKVISRRRVYLG